MAGEFILYRAVSNDKNSVDSDTTTKNVGDESKIEFGIQNYTEFQRTPDNSAYVTSFNAEITRTQTDNPVPLQDDTKNPDTGYSGTIITLQLFFDQTILNSEGNPTPSQAITRLIQWTGYDTTLDEELKKFRRGRFGIRDLRHSDINVTPIPERGVKILKFIYAEDYQFLGQVTGTLVLQISGKPVLPKQLEEGES